MAKDFRLIKRAIFESLNIRSNDGVVTDSFSVSREGAIVLNHRTQIAGIVTPTQLTASVNNYSPSGLSRANVLRLDSDASRDITGIDSADAEEGQLLVLVNVGANDIVLRNASASSSAANRFALGADLTLGADEGVTLLYDSISSRWRCIGKHV